MLLTCRITIVHLHEDMDGLAARFCFALLGLCLGPFAEVLPQHGCFERVFLSRRDGTYYGFFPHTYGHVSLGRAPLSRLSLRHDVTLCVARALVCVCVCVCVYMCVYSSSYSQPI